MNELAWGLFGGFGVLLLFCAIMDLRWRRSPIVLSMLILCCGLGFTISRLVTMTAQSLPTMGLVVGGGLIVVLLTLAYYFGAVGLSDVLVGTALLVVVLGIGGSRQILLAVLTASAVGMSVCLWALHRARRTLRFSGAPRTFHDVLALFLGRIEREPHLRCYPDRGRRGRKGRRTRGDEDLAQLEALRTPDGYHLHRDPCPLSTCYFVGYLAFLIGVM